MHEARKICNLLIARRKHHPFELSNLRLNKLLYFIHGWALTSRQDGLIRNHFMAWQHGPVIRPVYDSFKAFGASEICEFATYLDLTSGTEKPVAFEDLPDNDIELVVRIVTAYDKFTTAELVNLSHARGGPWDSVYSAWSRDNRLSLRIPTDLIRDHFLREAGGSVRH